jgi:hypothetical protein
MQPNDVTVKSSARLIVSYRHLCVPLQDRRSIEDRRAGYRGGRRAGDHPSHQAVIETKSLTAASDFSRV